MADLSRFEFPDDGTECGCRADPSQGHAGDFDAEDRRARGHKEDRAAAA